MRASFVILVHTFVYSASGQLLLLRRANTGVMDGYYTLPGGHRQQREAIADAAVRECREEAGVRIGAVCPVVALPYVDGVNFVFEATAWTGTPAIGEPEKCDALDFFAPDRLPEPIAPFVETALKCLTSGHWYWEERSNARLVGGKRSGGLE